MNLIMLKDRMESLLKEAYDLGRKDAETQWYAPHSIKPQFGEPVILELRNYTPDYRQVGSWRGGEDWLVGFQDDIITSQEIWRWARLPR